ncbi:hypothetical protein PENTCL1PPCAC_2272, partial [Pristionchus entomophagus]
QMAAGWFKFTGSSPYPALTANSDHSKFTYGNKQNRQYRMGWSIFYFTLLHVVSKKVFQIQGKRDEGKEGIVLDWISRSIPITFDHRENAIERLSHGIILCEFIQSINSHALARKISHKSSRFAATENLENFQDGLIALGLDRTQLFPISDLIEKKDITSLVNTLSILKHMV